MNYTGKQLTRVARKLGYQVEEGGKHILVFDPATGRRITIMPRGKIKPGTLAAILKQMGITKKRLNDLL